MLRFNASYSNDFGPYQAASGAIFEPPVDARGEPRTNAEGDPCLNQIGRPATNPLIRKLGRLVDLDDEEIRALAFATRNPRPHAAGQVLFHEDSRPDHLCLIVSGLAFRYKMLVGGRRQIIGYLLPGDLCDSHFIVSNRPDHSLALMTDSAVVRMPLRTVVDLFSRFPRIERAFRITAMMDRAILGEWLLSIGQRDAIQRLGHLFCEMYERARQVGMINNDDSFDLPISQSALADTTGLTPVHVNRTLQRLRSENLVALRSHRLTILSHERLAQQSGFDGQYLDLLRDLPGGGMPPACE